MDYMKALYDQLSLDFGVSAEDIAGSGNLFVPKMLLEGRRIYRNDDCILRILGINGKVVMSCSEPSLLEWLENEFSGMYGAWICEFDKLLKIEDRLRSYGHRIIDSHHFYVPAEYDVKPGAEAEIVWFEHGELERFRGDTRFGEALCFDENRPDMLSVAAVEGGKFLGMAGASADSRTAWQIGIDVLPEARGRGIGAYLTCLLKNEIIRRGRLPFYGTGDSHIQSQRVAIRAGFIPAWWELYTAGIPVTN